MDLPESAPIILFILVALGGLGGVGSLIAAIVLYRKAGGEIQLTSQTTEKIDADTADVVGRAYRALLDEQKKQFDERMDTHDELIEALRSRIRALETESQSREKRRMVEQATYEKRIADLEAEVDELIEWIKGQGLTPPPRHKRRTSS